MLAGLYLTLAIFAVAIDRKESGGGWITLHGMASFVVTLPVSLLGEKLNLKPDYRRNLDMILVIGICFTLVYFAGAGVAKLTRLAFSAAGKG